MFKECFRCKELKDVSCFYKNKTAADGLQPICKECRKEYLKGYNLNNREKYLAWKKNHYERNVESERQKRREYRKKTNNAAHKKWIVNNPTQYKANLLASSYINNNGIKRGQCFVCGETATESHHPNYDLPFNVVFVCKRCHSLIGANKINCPVAIDIRTLKKYTRKNGYYKQAMDQKAV